MTSKSIRIVVASLAAFAFVLGPPPPAWCQAKSGEPGSKVKKQIEVMESIFDKVLVDSPNLLVGSQHATRGLYLNEFGVLFTFETAILSRDHGDWWKKWDWSQFEVKTKDGQTIITLPSDDEDSTDSGKGKKRPLTPEEKYEAGKAEIREALMGYGDTLSGLREDQWVGIVLFFDDDEEIGDREISTVLMKAKMADLRAFGSERLSEKEMQSRVLIDEY